MRRHVEKNLLAYSSLIEAAINAAALVNPAVQGCLKKRTSVL
jgi:hypothetical protein